MTFNFDINTISPSLVNSSGGGGPTPTPEGTVTISRYYDIDDTGKLTYSTDPFDFVCDAVDIEDRALQQMYAYTPNITSVSFPNLTTISGIYAMYYCFQNATTITNINFPNLTEMSGNYCMGNVFANCTGLTSVSFPSLTTISGDSSMNSTFYNCSNLTSVSFPSLVIGDMRSIFAFCKKLTSASFPELTTLNGGGMFNSCTSLISVEFPKLSVFIGSQGLYNAFYGCTSLTSLSFPALTSNSFGSYTGHFDNMLLRVTDCTVHFPLNLESIIGSWASVTSGFGGTNTTVLFDLPATT